MARNPKVEVDLLKLYFGDPYEIDLENAPGKVTVYSPTIGDMVRIGERRFWETAMIFVCNTTQYRVMLWDLGIDWNTFSDFELFVLLYKQIDKEVSKLFFGDLDFSKFIPLGKEVETEDGVTKELILWDDENGIEINYDVYNHFCQYLRVMLNVFPEEKITASDHLKEWYINKDRRANERAKEKGDNNHSIQPIISACVNHPGFKYKLQELREVGMFEFYDSVSRLQIYEQATALMKGMYSGFIDSKNIKPEDYNFMREIVRDTNNSVSKAKDLKEQG